MPFLIPLFFVGGTVAGGLTTTGAIALAGGAVAASTAVSMSAEKQQAKQQASLYKYNARMVQSQAEAEAAQKKAAGDFAYQEKLKERDFYLSRQRAKFGKAGVLSAGTPILVELETAKNITMDALMAKYNTEVGVQNVLSAGQAQSNLDLYEAKLARKTGRLAVGQSLFSGAMNLANIGANYKLNAGGAGGGTGTAPKGSLPYGSYMADKWINS